MRPCPVQAPSPPHRPSRCPCRCRPEHAEPEQSERSQHQRHGVVEIGLAALKRRHEIGEKARTDADDDGEQHHLDARGDDIAEHTLGEKRRFGPEREGHQYEARQRRQLELDDGDEELHRQDEEGGDDDRPGEYQHDDRDRMVEETREPHQGARLLQERPGRLEADTGEIARPEQVVGGELVLRRMQTEACEGTEDDVGKACKIIQDQREDADIKDLPQETAQHIALLHRPEETGQRDVDADQDRGQEGDIALQQSEAAVDCLGEGFHEPVDDAKIVHAARSSPLTLRLSLFDCHRAP